MESLGEILRSMAGQLNAGDPEQRFQKMIQSPPVRQFLKSNTEVSEDTFRRHQNLMYQYIKEKSACDVCTGLEHCPNTVQGHLTNIQIGKLGTETYLYDEKISCSKYVVAKAQSNVNSRVKSFYVDHTALHQSIRFEDLVNANIGRAQAVEMIIEYLHVVRSKGLPKTGLYLSGDFGRGKTFLMCYLLRELAELGYTGAIVHMPQFVEEVKSMINEPLALREWVDTLKEADFLVLDDIGSENLSPWVRDHVLGAILTSRMNRKPTAYTSNYELEDLGKFLSFTAREGEDVLKGQRLMERIRNYVRVIKVYGENMREKFAKEQQG